MKVTILKSPQNASHWSKKGTGGNVIKDNLVNYNGDFYNQDIIDGLDRDNRVNTNYWNNNLNRYGVTTDEEFYKKFPTQEEFMFKNGKDYGNNLGVNRYVGNEKQMSFGGNIMTEKFSNLPMAENGVEIPIKNKSYSPIEAGDAISDYKLNPTYRYINDAKNIAEGKKRLKEQLQFNKSLTPELSKKIDSAKTFNDLNPIAGILQEGTYNLHPQAAEHYGLNIAPTRKGLEYLAKKFPNEVKDVKIGVHGQPDISPDKYQALISKLSEKDKKDYAKTNYQDSEWFYRNPEFKSFKFKNKEDYDKYVQDNKQNQYGDYFFSGTEGLYLKPEYPQDSLNKQTPRGENPTTERVVEKIVDRQPEYNINPNMDIQFPLPNVYGRTPLNYYQTDPNYINPRYLDVQPQLNEVSRGQRAFQNNLGSRGNTEMGNLLQSQANAYNQQNQIFGNKFNYDRNQDSQTQQFNANAKTQNDMYNQGTWYNQLEDPIRRRESNIGVQQLTDQYRGQERADQALAFKNTKEFMDKDYSYFTNLSPEAQVAYMEALSKQKQPTKKYGGKVKIKPTLKKKK